MGAEQDVEKKIQDYQELAKSNKNIDVASLMISALAQAQQDEIEEKKKKRAYLVSVVVPPFGLLYAVRYYFSGKSDGKHVAKVCTLLTAISLLIAWLIGKAMFSGVGGDAAIQQAQNINVDDIRRLLQP